MLFVVVCAGCAAKGKVTLANAKRIQIGMTEQEVTSILGESTEPERDGVRIYYENAKGSNDDTTGVLVGFRDAKVADVILTGDWANK